MKKNVDPILEAGRVTTGFFRSIPDHGMNGAFRIQMPTGVWLLLIVSDGLNWDHVSIEVENLIPSLKQRNPTWDEMCWVKDLCWEKNELVIQYHPPEKEYVNTHNNVLHLWKPQRGKVPIPPMHFV